MKTPFLSLSLNTGADAELVATRATRRIQGVHLPVTCTYVQFVAGGISPILNHAIDHPLPGCSTSQGKQFAGVKLARQRLTSDLFIQSDQTRDAVTVVR